MIVSLFSQIWKKLTGSNYSDPRTTSREAIDVRELLISTKPKEDILVDDDNRPVWPVYTPQELDSLEELAKLFGFSLREVTAHAGGSSAGVETVAALDEDLEDSARLYAHLTGRKFQHLTGLASLAQMDRQPSVFLLSLDQLNNELLTTLYADPQKQNAVGLICGEKKFIRRQVLVRAAAATFLGQPAIRYAGVFPLWKEGKMFIDDKEVPDLSRERLLSVVGSQAGILTVQTHSDGLDAMLSPTLTLCPLDQPPSSADRSRSNRCIQTNLCHRSGTSIPEFLTSSSFVSVDAFSAHILVWDVCWGAIPPDGLIDPAWGIGRSLFDSPRLGAVLAPWDLSLSSPKLVGRLIQNLGSGISVGEALLTHNSSMEAQRFRHRMCLFGDPRVSLRSATGPDQPVISPLKFEPVSTRLAKPTTSESTAFLRRLVTRMITRPSYAGSNLGEFGQRAMRAIQEYERAVEAGLETEDSVSSAGEMLRSAVLTCMRRRGPVMFNEWFKESVLVSSQSSSQCFACKGENNRLVTSILSVPASGSKRRVSRCQRCGIVEDVPVDSDLTLSVGSDRSVRLSGDLPSEAWKAQFLIRQQHTRRRLVFDWPAEPDGKPAGFFQLPISLPTGILQAGLVMMHRTDIYSLCQFIRGNDGDLHLQTPDGAR